MLRFAMAVITGYLVFAVSAALFFQLTGQDPHATPTLLFGIVSVIYGILVAAMGGLVAARIVPRSASRVSAGVGVLIAAGAIVSLAMEGPHERMWSQLSALLLMAPAAFMGGVLRRGKKS